MKATELFQRIRSNSAPVVIDARTGMEFRGGHVPGAINAPPLKILLKKVQLPEDKNSEMVIYCEHGQRGAISQRFLAFRGYRNTTLLEGHMVGWKKDGMPLEK